MSSISSLIKNISGQSGSPSAPAAKVPLARTKSTTDLAAGVKRKADTALEKSGDKTTRLGNGQAPASRLIKPLPSRPGLPSGTSPQKPASSISNPASISKTKSAAVSGVAAGRPVTPVSKSATPASRTISVSSTTSRQVNGTDVKQPSAGPAPAKPLSFKEKMKLKAQQNQAATKPVGQIVNVKATSLKSMIQGARGQKGKFGSAAGASTAKPGPNGKVAVARDGKARANGQPASPYKGSAAMKKPGAPQSTYTGTARPSAKPASTYRGTARPNEPAVKRTPAKPAKRYERDEYLGTDEDEEDEEGYGYENDPRYAEASDDYSDMEAGFDDISDEEREATRAAIKADKEEQAEIERLAALKAARKKSGQR